MSETIIGFCPACDLIREDDAETGTPLSDCACTVAHHAETCIYRKAVSCAVGVPCDLHRDEACYKCYACTCGAWDGKEPVYRARIPST